MCVYFLAFSLPAGEEAHGPLFEALEEAGECCRIFEGAYFTLTPYTAKGLCTLLRPHIGPGVEAMIITQVTAATSGGLPPPHARRWLNAHYPVD